jgi:hypothetical protein
LKIYRRASAAPEPVSIAFSVVGSMTVVGGQSVSWRCRNAYGDDEPQIAFLEVFNQEVRLPAAASVLGMPVEVVGFDYRDGRRGVVAECRREATRQAMAVVDLTFPPDSVAAWVQAAYRSWLGLKPYPHEMPQRWRPSWLR